MLHRRRPAGIVVVLAGAVLVAGGCAGPVEQTAPGTPEATGSVCAEVMAALPDEVVERGRRESRPADATAAWGDPPITLRCGVPAPAALTPTSECLEVNGIGWFAEPVDGGMIFTTIGRTVSVEVAVPNAYRPEADALIDLSDAVGRVPAERSCV